MGDLPGNDRGSKPNSPARRRAMRLPEHYLAAEDGVSTNAKSTTLPQDGSNMANSSHGLNGGPELQNHNATLLGDEGNPNGEEDLDYEALKDRHDSRPLGAGFIFPTLSSKGLPGSATMTPQQAPPHPESCRDAPGSTDMPSRKAEMGGHPFPSAGAETSPYFNQTRHSRCLGAQMSGEDRRVDGYLAADNSPFHKNTLAGGEHPQNTSPRVTAHQTEGRGQCSARGEISDTLVEAQRPGEPRHCVLNAPSRPTRQYGGAGHPPAYEHMLPPGPEPETHYSSKKNSSQHQGTETKNHMFGPSASTLGRPMRPLPSEHSARVRERPYSRSSNVSKQRSGTKGTPIGPKRIISRTSHTGDYAPLFPQESEHLPSEEASIATFKTSTIPYPNGMTQDCKLIHRDYEGKIRRQQDRIEVQNSKIQQQRLDLQTRQRELRKSLQVRTDLERQIKELEEKLNAEDSRVTKLEGKVKTFRGFLNDAVLGQQGHYEGSLSRRQDAVTDVRNEETAYKTDINKIREEIDATRAALEKRTKAVVDACKNRELERECLNIPASQHVILTVAVVNKIDQLTEQLRDRDLKLHHEKSRVVALTTQLGQASEAMKLDLQAVDCRTKEILQKLSFLYADCAEIAQNSRKDREAKFCAVSERLDLLATLIPAQVTLQSTMKAFARDGESRQVHRKILHRATP